MIRRLIILLLIVGATIILYEIYSENQIKNCYLKCSDYHLLGEATHWDYIDFIIDDRDTIWIENKALSPQ